MEKITRRGFLEMIVAGAVALTLGLGTGCSGSKKDELPRESSGMVKVSTLKAVPPCQSGSVEVIGFDKGFYPIIRCKSAKDEKELACTTFYGDEGSYVVSHCVYAKQ